MLLIQIHLTVYVLGEGKWIPPPHYQQNKPWIKNQNYNSDQNLWLFNIRTDPLEKNDVSSEYPDIVHHLLDRLSYYNSTAVPVRYPQSDPEADPALHVVIRCNKHCFKRDLKLLCVQLQSLNTTYLFHKCIVA
jgi:hypothetical protein